MGYFNVEYVVISLVDDWAEMKLLLSYDSKLRDMSGLSGVD
jgi:hypothetical protein